MDRPAVPGGVGETTAPFVPAAHENEIRGAHVFELHTKLVSDPLNASL